MTGTQTYDSDGEPDPLLLFSQNINRSDAHSSKRRRLESTSASGDEDVEYEEIVDTSDADEREELASSRPGYLENAFKRMKPFPKYSDYVQPDLSTRGTLAIFATPTKPKSQNSPGTKGHSRGPTPVQSSPFEDTSNSPLVTPLSRKAINRSPGFGTRSHESPVPTTNSITPDDEEDHPVTAAAQRPEHLEVSFWEQTDSQPRDSTPSGRHSPSPLLFNSPTVAAFNRIAQMSPMQRLRVSRSPTHVSQGPMEHVQQSPSPNSPTRQSPDPADFDLSPGPRRNLRQRTAMQQNPYTLELRYYKKFMKRAGQKEAIVKHLKKGYHSDGEDEDYEVNEAEEESQEQTNTDLVDESIPSTISNLPHASRPSKTYSSRRHSDDSEEERRRNSNEGLYKRLEDFLGGAVDEDDDDDFSALVFKRSVASRRAELLAASKHRRKQRSSTPVDPDEQEQNSLSSPTAVMHSSAPHGTSSPTRRDPGSSVSRRRVSFTPVDDETDMDDIATFTRRLAPRAHRYADELRREEEEEKRKRRHSDKENHPSFSEDDEDQDEDSFFRSQFRSRNRIARNPQPIVVEGDPESSEPEVMARSDNNDDDRVILISSDSDSNSDNSLPSWSDHQPRVHQRKINWRDVQYEADDMRNADPQDDNNDMWLDASGSDGGPSHQPKRAPRDTSKRHPEVLREGDLIDRMLQRTQPINIALLGQGGKSSSKSMSHSRTAAGHRQGTSSKKPNMTLSTTTVLMKRKRARHDGHSSGRLRQSRLKVSSAGAKDVGQDRSVAEVPRMTYGTSSNKSKPTHKHKNPSTGQQQGYVFLANGEMVSRSRPISYPASGPSAIKPLKPLQPVPLSRPTALPRIPEPSLPHLPPDRVDDMVSTVKLMRRPSNLLDYGYFTPPLQAKFSKESYLRMGRLVDLITLLKEDVPHRRPISCGDLDASMALTDLDDLVPTMFDEFHDWARGLKDVPEARAKMRFLCNYASWVSQQPSGDEDISRISAMIDDATMHLLRRLEAEPEDKSPVNEENMLWVGWFALEISLRLWRIRNRQDPVLSGQPLANKTPSDLSLAFLLQRLHQFGFDRTMDSLSQCNSVTDESQFESTSAELWICIMHLMQSFHPNNPAAFWDQLRSSHVHSHCAKVSLKSSECVWKGIFSILVLSRFSKTGVMLSESQIPSSWSAVVFALNSVRLKISVEEDRLLPSDVVKSRDVYHRLLLTRCWHLATRFKWSLVDPYLLFKSLIEIFRSRSFGSMLGEEADFPSFIRHGCLDTAFSDPNKKNGAIGIFIKLILRAAHDIETDPARALDPANEANWWKRVKKLTNPLIPVGSTSFTKEGPPVGNELSKLYNRFSLAITAVRLEHWNTDFRLMKAKDYQDFQKADVNSRTACIRGMMHMGVVLREQGKDASKIMIWYGDLLKVLLEEGAKAFDQAPVAGELGSAKEVVVMLMLQLLRAVRTVLETSSLQEEVKYPDPSFLEGANLDQLLRSSISNDPRVGVEIREYVRTFLGFRLNAIPPRSEPQAVVPIASTSNESQESDEFGDLALDFEDPYMHTLLGERQPLEWELKDQQVSAYIKSSLSPSMFNYLQKHYDEYRQQSAAAGDNEDALWIECWVECIDVMVRNHMKAWEDYQEWGSESLDRIPLSVHSNVLHLQFLHAVLRIDPTSYAKTKDWIIPVWISSLGSSHYSLERYYYTRLLFDNDGLHHPLLKNLSYEDLADKFTHGPEMEQLRLSFLKGVAKNLGILIRSAPTLPKDQHIVAAGINGVVGALMIMKEETPRLDQRDQGEQAYNARGGQVQIGKDFVQYLEDIPPLWENRRIVGATAFLRD